MQSISALLTRPTSPLLRCSASRSVLRSKAMEIVKFNMPLPSLATVNAVESLRMQFKRGVKNGKRYLSTNNNPMSVLQSLMYFDLSEYFPVRPADLSQATGSMDLAMAQKELSALGYVVGSSLTVCSNHEHYE